MKRMILCLTFVAFAIGGQIVFAQCVKDKEEKAACAEKAKACPIAKAECKKHVAACKKEGAPCCKFGAASEKRVLKSPKAAGEAAN